MGHKFEKFCKSPENIENYEKAKADTLRVGTALQGLFLEG